MRILSNVEFEKLTVDQTTRLKMLAKKRCDQDPDGFLTLAELDEMSTMFKWTGDAKSVAWLGSIKTLATSGKLKQIRTNSHPWQNHVLEVHTLYAQSKIPFGLNDSVMVKENGKYGQVVDYIVDKDQFVVVLDPFQMKTYSAKDLQKVAKKEGKTG